ncbi:diphthine methyltransferase isoform X2 [Aphidius gifuensis]|nr:diphthine methyltransferase isoform X2 [Aphidius gifuensis]
MFKTLDNFDTIYSADSVEWCPIDDFKDLFVCGTYQLAPEDEQSNEKSQKRDGKIYLFRIETMGKLKLLQTIDVPAVLDMKWSHVRIQNNIYLGVVNSIGYIQIYKLQIDETTGDAMIKLHIEKKLSQKSGDEILALSLDWSTGKCQNDNINDAKITVSDSEGKITIFNFDSHNDLSVLSSLEEHEFQAWITAFNYWNTNIIYSGGDDCKFKWYDLRVDTKLIGSNRIHEAGVTSLHSNSNEEFILASGSYDEKLRIWDTRNFRRPISENNLSGGVWRLKWDPFYHKYLLGACMYGGFKLIDCNSIDDPKIIGEYNEHKSIAYGCDWSSLDNDTIGSKLSEENCQNIVIATCSFYDHKLDLSTFILNKLIYLEVFRWSHNTRFVGL